MGPSHLYIRVFRCGCVRAYTIFIHACAYAHLRLLRRVYVCVRSRMRVPLVYTCMRASEYMCVRMREYVCAYECERVRKCVSVSVCKCECVHDYECVGVCTCRGKIIAGYKHGRALHRS